MEWMNEWMFNDTPAQSLHRLLGGSQKVFMYIFKNNNILKIYKAIKHSVKCCAKYIYYSYIYNYFWCKTITLLNMTKWVWGGI